MTHILYNPQESLSLYEQVYELNSTKKLSRVYQINGSKSNSKATMIFENHLHIGTIYIYEGSFVFTELTSQK